MKPFIAIQNTYHELQVGLFQRAEKLLYASTKKFDAAADLIPLIDSMLTQAKITLSDLSCIVANQGPGPFTTLRVVIASANGLNAGGHIPLVGVDAFDALLFNAIRDRTYLVLFNAFNQDVYYALQSGGSTEKGYMHIKKLVDHLATVPGPITVLASAADLFGNDLKSLSNLHYPDSLPEYPTLDEVAALGYKRWKSNQGVGQELFPLYLKKHRVEDRL